MLKLKILPIAKKILLTIWSCKSITKIVYWCIQLISVASCVASHRKLKIFNEVSRDPGEWLDAKVFQWEAFVAAKVATRECQELNASTGKQQRLRRVIGKLPVPYKLPEVAAKDSYGVRLSGMSSLSMQLQTDKSLIVSPIILSFSIIAKL